MTQIYTRPTFSSPHDRPFVFDKHFGPLQVRDINEKAHSPTGWKIPPSMPSPVESDSNMSDSQRGSAHEPAIAKIGDDLPKRPELSQRSTGTREQLPSLSSLFPSSPRPAMPQRESHTERPALFSPPSPQDRRAGDTHRPWEPSTHRPHSQSISSQYSYTTAPTPTDAHRALAQDISQTSPRFFDNRFPQPSSTATPSSRWSPNPRSESSSFRESFAARPPLEHQSSMPTMPHRAEPQAQYLQQSDSRSSYTTAQYPPTPASSATDPVPVSSKDSLGPKIWTGTQFLPRFVRQAEVPGEGLCYFYDDGTHCKTHIDGEAVNAHWGVTKAGKPRKRLAIACITCREKKIKCDPDYPRCIQCEKFGRVCKFKNAPRGGAGSPETPPADEIDASTPSRRSPSPTSSYKLEKREAHSLSPQGSPNQESKRRRLNEQSYPATPFASHEREDSHNAPQRQSGSYFAPSPPVTTTSWSPPSETQRALALTERQWAINPYVEDPRLTDELMATYFVHIAGSATYCMLPELAFMRWLRSPASKTPDDLMLVYSMLALGAMCSSRPAMQARGKEYVTVARHAADRRHFTLQLVQSRLLLALYYYGTNSPSESWDFCGSAIRAASGLKLNIELEKSDEAALLNSQDTFAFGLNRHGYAECRRRTFWAAYIMDRFNGFCSGHVSILHPEDVFLRLPCDVKSFEAQLHVQNPYFSPNTPPISNDQGTIGSMAYLVNVCSIWGDVMANIYRQSQTPSSIFPAEVEAERGAFYRFHEATMSRLEAWRQCLPNIICYSEANMDMTADSGLLGTFLTMHNVYHSTVMKLNRHIPTSVQTSPRFAATAFTHAEQVVRIMDSLANRQKRRPESSTRVSSPFIGYTIITAIDVLSARGNRDDARMFGWRVDSCARVLGELSTAWESARVQSGMVAARVEEMKTIDNAIVGSANNSPMSGSGWSAANGKRDEVLELPKARVWRETGRWEMRAPVERTFRREMDCVYAGSP